MGQAARAANAAAGAGHALNEVAGQSVFGLFKQCHTAGLNAIAGHGFQIELNALLLHGLGHRVGHTAGPGENAPIIRGVVQHVLGKGGDVQIPAVKQSLEFLKGQHRVDQRPHPLLAGLCLFGGAWANEHHLGGGVGLLQVFSQPGHGRKVVGDVLLELREGGLDVADKARTAGAGQKALLRQLPGLLHGHHVRAQSGLDDGEEAQLFQARNHLAQVGVSKLAGNGGSHHRVYLVLGVVLALFQHVDHVEHEGLIRHRAKGAHVNAGPALDALPVINSRGVVLVDGDGLYLAGHLAGALAVHNGGIGADLGALAALHALGFVDVRHMVVVKRDGAPLAHVLTAVGQAPPAGVGDLVPSSRALIAGNVNDLDNVGVVGMAAHGHLHPFGQNGPLLVHAAAHGGLFAGNDGLGNVHHVLQEFILPGKPGGLPKDLVF